MTTTSSASSGTSALSGFEYQRRVSVLAALDIVAASQRAQQIVLEPIASEEDLETEIADEVDAAVGSIAVSGYQLVIQCKRRTTGPFDVTAMKSLLAHGVVRTKPKDRLANPATRYLLVTNADLVGTARDLHMKKFNDWPDAIPASLSAELGVTAPGRIGVLNVLDDEKLNGRIKEFLSGRFMVPTVNVGRCVDALAKAALDRMLGLNSGVWLRAEIEQEVREFGGFTGTSEALEGYVQPTNWNELKAQLSKHHALVLIGASGTGKTRTASALLADLQASIAGLEVRHVTGGPESIPSETRGSSIAFEIEDPWGRYRLSPSAVPWNDRLPDLLRTARADRYFVVTSRSDILDQAKLRDLPEHWIARLEEEHYGEAQRSQLYENRYDQMSREVQTALTGHKRTAMEQLATPLEVERFFANLISGRDGNENDAEFVHRCLRDARETSIEQALVNGVRVRDDWALAAIVWGLFQAQPRLTFEVTPAIQSGLSDRDRELEDALEPFLHFLIAGRNLRQVETALSLQHPRVEQGLEAAMKEKPDRSRRSLRTLVLTLIEIDALAGSDWGREGAARIIGAAAEAGLKLAIPPLEQGRLDAWLENYLSSDELDEERLKIAAAAGSGSSDLSELARWFINNPRNGTAFETFLDWQPPSHDDAWYQRLGANPAGRALSERFVAKLLPLRYLDYPRDFHMHLARFGYDLRVAFKDAAASIVGSSGYSSNEDAVLEGALIDRALFEEVVSAAAEHERGDRGIDKALQLRLLNGELNYGAYEHYSESAGDNTVTSSTFLRRYVREMRKSGQMAALARHNEIDELLWHWIPSAGNDPTTAQDEMPLLANAAAGKGAEYYFWESVREAFPSQLLDQLRSRLIDEINDGRTVKALIHVAALHAPDEIERSAAVLYQQSRTRELLGWAAHFGKMRSEESLRAAADAATTALAASLPREIANVALALGGLAALEDEGRDFAATLDLDDIELEVDILRLREVRGEGLSADLLDTLGQIDGDTSADISNAETIAGIAGRTKDTAMLVHCLSHRFADVRDEALTSLSKLAIGPLPAELLALASDKSYRVKTTLISLLEQRRHASHIDALLVLAADRYDNNDAYSHDEPNYPIAQRAAKLLIEELPLVDGALRTRLNAMIGDTEDSAVKQSLIMAIINRGTHELRRRVVEIAAGGGGSQRFQRLSAQALWEQRASLDPSDLVAITSERLRSRPAATALQLCLLIGARETPARAIELATSVAANPARRGLVIPLAVGAMEQPDLAPKILATLAADEADIITAFMDGTRKLPPALVDRMADVRVASELRRVFREQLEAV